MALLHHFRTHTRIGRGFPVFVFLFVLLVASVPAGAQEMTHSHHGASEEIPLMPSASMIIHMIRNPMLPGVKRAKPSVSEFLPGTDIDPSTLPIAGSRQVLDLSSGDTLALEATLVRKMVAGQTFVMYAFNEQIPGPLIRVERGAEIHVRFTNRIDMETTVHWHGLRLDNRFDGVPGLTQDPVRPGETFDYTIRFPDAGIYWYHPHVHENIQQDLGLYGNMLVRPDREPYEDPVHREEVVTLDDILVEGTDLVPYGREAANFSIMGRFGNV
ncbi:MAG: multicopper oxidase domain-containing protein, partial [Gemmatimonadota bacterium]